MTKGGNADETNATNRLQPFVSPHKTEGRQNEEGGETRESRGRAAASLKINTSLSR